MQQSRPEQQPQAEQQSRAQQQPRAEHQPRSEQHPPDIQPPAKQPPAESRSTEAVATTPATSLPQPSGRTIGSALAEESNEIWQSVKGKGKGKGKSRGNYRITIRLSNNLHKIFLTLISVARRLNPETNNDDEFVEEDTRQATEEMNHQRANADYLRLCFGYALKRQNITDDLMENDR